MDNELLKDTVLKLKDRIIKTEAGNIQLSETDTRQGLINPLFRGYCQVNSPPSTMPGCTLAGPATFDIAFRPTSSAMPSGSTTDTA